MKSGNKKMSQNQDQSTNGSPDTLKKLRRTIEILRQGIEDMRLTTLYNRFDLESTRRERDFILKLYNDLNDSKNKK